MTRARDTANTQENIGGSVPPFVAGKNGILNSAFQVWQRNTSFANTAQTIYTADRWVTVGTPAAFTISRQATGDTTNLPSIQYCARIQRNSGQTNTTNFDLVQGLETSNSIPFAGKTVTLSFYARAGANYSPTSSILAAALYSGTGTDQSPTAAFTGQVAVINQNATLTTTWQRFSYTASVASSATQLKTIFTMGPTGTAGTNDFYEITGVQLEIGNVATPFTTATGTIQGELAACQRYFYAVTADGVNNGAAPVTQFGTATGTGSAQFTVPLPVTMRTAPSFSVSSVSGFRVYDALNAASATTNVTLASVGSQPNAIIIAVSAPSLTQYRPYYLIPGASATNYLYMSAEL